MLGLPGNLKQHEYAKKKKKKLGEYGWQVTLKFMLRLPPP